MPLDPLGGGVFLDRRTWPRYSERLPYFRTKCIHRHPEVGHPMEQLRIERKIEAHDVGNLSEWLLRDVFRGLLFSLANVDWDELERNIFLVQHCCNSASAGGEVESVEFQNHCETRSEW